jgi:tetratricopeptide (TPR) repeat protein
MLYHNLGSAQVRSERYEEALETFRAGLELSPDYADVHAWMGLALEGLERSDEALASHRRAVEIDPRNAPAYLNLGNELRERGETDEALAAYERAHALFEPRADDFSRHWAKYARERIAELRRGPRLLVILAGGAVAETPEEWASAVMAGYRAERYAEVVALTEETLATAPELLEGSGWGAYNSACSAALLATRPAADVDDAERARASALAREWLEREVESWCGVLERDPVRAGDMRERLRQALQDPDFAGVRGTGSGASLPEPEREQWRRLWERIERAAAERDR